jgi:hypothetical protein
MAFEFSCRGSIIVCGKVNDACKRDEGYCELDSRCRQLLSIPSKNVLVVYVWTYVGKVDHYQDEY